MKNLGKRALSGLSLLLAGIICTSCIREKEPVPVRGLHGVIESYALRLDGKENLYNRFEHEKTEVDSFKPQTYAGDAYKYFQLGTMSQIKGISTGDQKMLDSAKNCYNKMLMFLGDSTIGFKSQMFSQDEIQSCNSDFITYGLLKFYNSLSYLTKDAQYYDSTEKYLSLAINANNSKTPARVLLSQNLEKFRLNQIRGNSLASIENLKEALNLLQKIPMNRTVQKQNEIFYCHNISKLYSNIGQPDSSKKYSKKANKIAKKYKLGYLLKHDLRLF